MVHIPGGQGWVLRTLVDSVRDLSFGMSWTLRTVKVES